MRKTEQFPIITKVGLGIAQANGCINRLEPMEHILEVIESVLGAEDVYEHDLLALETWLNTLTPEQIAILEDGEESELDELETHSPRIHGSGYSAHLFSDIYEAVTG